MSLFARFIHPFPRTTRFLVATLPALGLLGATAWLFFWIRGSEAAQSTHLFIRHAESVAALLEARVANTDHALIALRLLYENSDEVTPDEFQHAALSLRRAAPDLSAVEWVPCVPDSQQAAFEKQLQQTAPDFAIKQVQPGHPGSPLAEPAGEFWPIAQISPLTGNEAAFGFDLRHGPTVATLRQARSSRALALSHPLRLVQDPPNRLTVIFILPAYHRHTDQFLGWVQGLARVERLFAFPAGTAERLGLAFQCEDLDSPPEASRTVFRSPALPPLATAAPWSRNLDFGGRHWRLSAWPSPSAAPASRTRWLVLALGTAAAALLALYLQTLLRRARTVEQLVDQRTAELAASNRTLASEIAQRRQAEETLARDALILASVRDAIVVADASGRITFWNTGATALFGWSSAEMLGRRLPMRLSNQSGPDFFPVLATVTNGRDWRGEWEITRKDGSSLWADLSVRRFAHAPEQPAGIIALAFDVTPRHLQQEQQQALERKMQETQKLESLGVLAGGIAHDFNNLLTGILGNASLLRQTLAPDNPRQDDLAAIESAGQRAADLCQQMLAYSGRARFVLKPIDLSGLVGDTTRLVMASVAKSAQLEFRLARDLPAVHADATQLRQIVMNLVINASDALEGRPGRIALATATVAADRSLLDATPLGRDLPIGDYALLEVRDSGCGMNSETLARIFDPFFTTKSAGRGLGLAAVLGIVRSHRGTLQVESEVGRGTVFRVFLPFASPSTAPSRVEAPPAANPRRGCGCLLVIDDETVVRETTRHILTTGGYQVVTAADGAAGIAEFSRQPQRFVAALIDFAMPQLNGPQTFAALRRLRPDLPVLLMSGYSDHETIAACTATGPVRCLQKPFLADALLAAVADAIDRPPAP